MKLVWAVTVGFILLSVAVAASAENRCGWLMNPTPANWRLTDRDGTWTLMSQGEEPRDEVMENLPDFDEKQYVASNGNYGYGCACLSVDVDRAAARILRVHSGRTLPLAKCVKDGALPSPE